MPANLYSFETFDEAAKLHHVVRFAMPVTEIATIFERSRISLLPRRGPTVLRRDQWRFPNTACGVLSFDGCTPNEARLRIWLSVASNGSSRYIEQVTNDFQE